MSPQIPIPTFDNSATLVWLRRDLRLEDNHALFEALSKNKNVLPLFIFDSAILEKLEDPADRRVHFIYAQLERLHFQLTSMGSSLLVLYGDPVKIFKTLPCKKVYANTDYEPYARKRDRQVMDILQSRDIVFYTFKDHVIFHKDEILKKDKTPYTIFTPYSKQWKLALNQNPIQIFHTESKYTNFLKTIPFPFPTLSAIGFTKSKASFPASSIPTTVIEKYDQQRNYPGINGTSRLGVHLRFGTISIRKLVNLAHAENEVFLNELIWRDFFQMILWHYPQVDQAFKSKYDQIVWRNDEHEFQLWCEGKTGYPLVDAGMRELNETGFMHNRVRMVVSSFLTKHLVIDWRWGEAYFAEKLLDFDLAANNGGWQWAAGCGCDAAPYFRVFNPSLQEKKFDPDRVYIRKWVKEIDTDQYPTPIVEHAFARDRILKVYKKALQ